MKKNIDWIGFKENVETYIRKHRGISGKMLKQLFDNYSENAVKNCTIPHVSVSLVNGKFMKWLAKKAPELCESLYGCIHDYETNKR
jgi:hypothetical protein